MKLNKIKTFALSLIPTYLRGNSQEKSKTVLAYGPKGTGKFIPETVEPTEIQKRIETMTTNGLGYDNSPHHKNPYSSRHNHFFYEEDTSEDLKAHLGELELETTKNASIGLKNAVKGKQVDALLMRRLLREEELVSMANRYDLSEYINHNKNNIEKIRYAFKKELNELMNNTYIEIKGMDQLIREKYSAKEGLTKIINEQYPIPSKQSGEYSTNRKPCGAA